MFKVHYVNCDFGINIKHKYIKKKTLKKNFLYILKMFINNISNSNIYHQ